MEWVPTCGVANNLSWAEERSAVALVNYVPHTSQEVDRIAELRAHCLMGWPDDSSSEEEDDEQMEEGGEQEGDEHEEAEGQGEVDPESPPSGTVFEQGKTGQEVKPWG